MLTPFACSPRRRLSKSLPQSPQNSTSRGETRPAVGGRRLLKLCLRLLLEGVHGLEDAQAAVLERLDVLVLLLVRLRILLLQALHELLEVGLELGELLLALGDLLRTICGTHGLELCDLLPLRVV